MKVDLINVVGALSIGALALTGCKSDGGGGDQPAAEKTADGEGGCSPGSGKSGCEGKSECKGAKSECKAAKSE